MPAEDGSGDVAPRPSLLGPGPAVVIKPPCVTVKNPVKPCKASTGRVYAEDLFAASVAADEDKWICFVVNSLYKLH